MINPWRAIGIDLSKQTNTTIPQQISFFGKLEEENDGAAMFLISEEQQILNFSLASLIIRE